MRVSFAPAFLKLLSKMDPPVRDSIKHAVAKVIDFYEGGSKSAGLGIKRLRRNVWETRAGLRVRVIYFLEGDELRFVLAGNHDDIRSFLRQL